MYCGTERDKCACPCGGVSTALSGTRVLGGFKRAEGPASVRLGAMLVTSQLAPAAMPCGKARGQVRPWRPLARLWGLFTASESPGAGAACARVCGRQQAPGPSGPVTFRAFAAVRAWHQLPRFGFQSGLERATEAPGWSSRPGAGGSAASSKPARVSRGRRQRSCPPRAVGPVQCVFLLGLRQPTL